MIEGGGFFPYFFGIVSVQCQAIPENICQHCSPKPEAYAHVVETEVDISRTNAIPVELNH